jgi:hypothetical protein
MMLPKIAASQPRVFAKESRSNENTARFKNGSAF